MSTNLLITYILLAVLFTCTSLSAAGQPVFKNGRITPYFPYDGLIDTQSNMIRVTGFQDSLDLDRMGYTNSAPGAEATS